MSYQIKQNHLKLVLKMMLVMLVSLCFAQDSLAQGSNGGSGGSGGSSGGSGSSSSSLDQDKPNDATQTGAYDVREDYRRANKLSIPFGPPTKRNPDGLDEVQNRESIGPSTVDHGPGPVYAWPVVIPSATSAVPTKRDTGITKHRLQTFGYPISDTQYQMIHRMNQQIMLEEMFDPERIMWLGAVLGTSQVQDTSNSFANVIRNQCASAIDYVSCPIDNFTIQAGNKWNKIRDQLFLPMAVLFLLPGAMLAQVKVIVAAGMPIGGQDTSPFEGIIRSIVAIFLIPATYLVVNYGLDLNNSLTYTIANEYNRIFGSNMYKDALCLVIRAFPLRQAQENRNGIFKEVVPWTDNDGSNGTPASGLESRSLKVKTEDPCSGEFYTDPNRADEQAPFLSVGQRLVTNGSNAVIAMTWNILCAFQVVFIMYLWLVGPVVAALWVYPHEALRSAFPSWVEGVVTLCFWALFWNTTVLLMACFKGVDSTGSIITSALLFLSTASVKSAFDFAGLVKDAGKSAADALGGQLQQMAGKATPGVAGGGQGQGSRGGAGGGRAGAAAGGRSSRSIGATGTVSGSASHAAGIGGAHGAGTLGSLAGGGGSSASLHVSGTVTPTGGSGHSGALAGHGSGRTGRELTDTKQSLSSTGLSSGGLSAADRGGMGPISSSTPSAPPLVNPGSAPNEVNVNNLSHSFDSTNNFSSFNSSTMAGTVNGAQGQYSASQASSLIGSGNLANFPREGSVVSKEQAYQNYNNALREVDLRNGKEGAFTADSQARNDLMQNWKHMLEEGEKNSSPDGTMMTIPDSLPGTTAGGNWNLTADGGVAAMPQGFGEVFNRVSDSLGGINSALTMPGGAGGGLNPQAVEGMVGLAREMTQVGPQLGGMSPQAIGSTMEGWQQRADALSQQMYQGSSQAMSPDSYARMQTDAQQAAYSLSQFQQQYAMPAGNPMPPESGYGMANNSYGAGGVSPDQYTYNQQQNYQTAYQSPEQGYYQQGGGGFYQQSVDPGQGQQYISSTGSPAPDQSSYGNYSGYVPPTDQYQGPSPQQPPVDPSFQQNYSSAYDQNTYYQQQQADQNAYYQQQQQADQNAYYQQQQQQADQNAYQQQQQADQSTYYQQQQADQYYNQAQAYYGQPQQSDQGYGPQQQDSTYGTQSPAPDPSGYGYGSQPQVDPSQPWGGSPDPGTQYPQPSDPQYQQYQQQYQQPEYQQQNQPSEYGGSAGGGYTAGQQPQPQVQQPMITPPIPHSQEEKPHVAKPEHKPTPESQQKEAPKHMGDALKFIKKPGSGSQREMTEEEKRAMRRAMGIPDDEDQQ